jgi:hypothetical protein
MTQELIASIRSLCASGEVEQALGVIAGAEVAGIRTADLLVWKARCLQLSGDGPLGEVEEALQAALTADDRSVDAWVEWGWFLLNVRDRSDSAAEAFGRARDLLRPVNTDVALGLARCAQEGEPEVVTSQVVRDTILSLADVEKIDRVLKG